MILVDSSVWIDFFRGVPTPASARLRQILGEQIVLTGDLILAEVLRGFLDDPEYRRARSAMLDLPVVELGGRDIALQAAHNARRLREMGVTIRGTIEALIATRCIEDDLVLLHADRGFEPFERHLGLRCLS